MAFERERRPGDLSGDIDFAENMDIEEANKVQSEHWSTNQCTLFVGVWQWLDVEAWNKTEGKLEVGAEVTVWGEMAGESRASSAFWAKVVPRDEHDGSDGSYTVENAAGVQFQVQRKELRHRVFVKQCHAGVTGDKKHDR